MTTRTGAPMAVIAEPGLPFVAVEREFDAPRDLVFRCWSEPELLAQWLGPHGMAMRVDEFDFRHGGAYRYVHVDREGTEYAFRGVFHGPLRPDAILQTFEYEGAPGQVSLDRLELRDLGNGRTLARMHSVSQSVEARDAMVANGMAEGMRQGFERLDGLLATLAGGHAA